MLVALMTGTTGNVWAVDLTGDDIIINKIPADTKDENDQPVVVAGTVVKSVSGRVVTLTVTPKSGTDYQINEKMITVEPMVDPAAAPRRSSILANTIAVSRVGTTDDYTFTLPEQYSKANVTVRFFIPAASGITQIFSLEELKNGDKYELAYNGKYEIVSDLDASGFSGFTITGNTTGAFEGTLTAQAKADGTFPVIMNLTKPLFTTATNATICNIMLQQVSISQDGYVGAICGTANGTTRIYNCGILPTTLDNTGYRSTVGSTNTHCGSLVGYLDGYARVINCFSYANVSAGTADNIYAGGLVGYNAPSTCSNQKEATSLNTMVMNCIFYGDIIAGKIKRPVYGGTRIKNTNVLNNVEQGINNYNYYCEEEASYDDNYSAITDYNCSWPVAKKHLIRFEVYRNILNSNRRLCTWWVNGTFGTAPTDIDVEDVGIAKWVLDKGIAPYPILKKWGKYHSTFYIDPDYVWNPKTMSNMARSTAKAWEGKSDGALSVTIKGGSNNNSASVTRKITITDIDTLGYDYCAKKIQLPYYNEIFGDPNGTTWEAKYAKNYTSQVVTGWKVIEVKDADDFKGTRNSFNPAWEDGYNYADRNCTDKDIFSSSNPRVFAQGGYYYVPNNVKSITIEAYWGNAVYLCNKERRLDLVSNATVEFTPSGQLPAKVNNIDVKTSLSDAVSALTVLPGNKTVYDQAIVLVGNYQQNDYQTSIRLAGNNYDNAAKPFTIMSADFDFDNEPDFCFQAGMKDGGRENVHPIRFDFLIVPDLTMAVRTSNTYYGMRIFVPQGHFEITETSYMYTTQFEYDKRSDNNKYDKHEAPMILNGGEHMQIVSTENFADATSGATATKRVDRTSYFLMGGNVYMKAFTPGCHTKRRTSTRHCAVNAIGGEFPEFYLSGMFNANFFNITDNPHAYLDGGKFGIVAGAGMESVGAKNETNGGNVTFKINHSWIREFYGGGINATRPVTGNISTTCDNSVIHKYCGGPKLGDMSNTKTITNIINNTVFDEYYGGGNGGTNLFRENQYDGYNIPAPGKDETDLWTNNSKGKFNSFTPLKYVANKGYHAEFEFELLPMPQGNTNTVPRTYLYYASFSKTTVAPITNTITDCTFNGNYYGGGNLGAVGGDVSSTLQGHTIVRGSVFGAGFSASIPSFPVHDKSTKIFPYRDYAGFIHEGSLDYKKYTTAAGEHAVGDTIYYTWINEVPASWNISPKPSIDNPTFEYPSGSGNWYCYTTEKLTGLGAVTGNVTLNIEGTTIVGGDVYGGGESSNATGTSVVNIVGGTVEGDVYGGGALADVDGNTKVILLGGTVNGDVYGGGKGRLSGTKDENGNDLPEMPATVNATTVYLNGMEKDDYIASEYSTLELEHANDNDPYTVADNKKGCVVKGSIFGCNNLNGTPLGGVKVHVFGTQHADKDEIREKFGIKEIDEVDEELNLDTNRKKLQYWIDQAERNGVDEETINTAKGYLTDDLTTANLNAQISNLRTATVNSLSSHHYDVHAVYGGGNLAAYVPTDLTNGKTQVIIDGCGRTSIQQVYGGGNAASTPATKVTVNGTYEVEELFGGGNGKDQISKDGGKTWLANPGANVGFKDYSDVEDTYNTKEKRTEGELGTAFKAKYVYGSGKAAVNIFGGKIHRVFGGSNTKGNVRQTAVTMLDERSSCDFVVDEAYGGGKSAPMDAEAKLLMACIPGLKQAYGGAEAADIQGNVVLNITNGTFDRVFGGNNESGTIRGSITVNIEEVGCKPIIIGELYGGGNLAGYSVYGYKEINEGTETEPKMVWKPRESATDSPAGITLATENTPYADPQVNVKSFTSIGNIYGGGYGASAVMVGNPTVEINEVLGEHASSVDAVLGEDYTTPSGYPVPPHASGAIGAINNVFGGGNAAAVKGSTTVKIGTRDEWTVTAPKKDTNGKTLYEEDGVTPQTEVKEKDVVGANIVGNVYGGGNEAEVTGNTNVQIGKKM